MKYDCVTVMSNRTCLSEKYSKEEPIRKEITSLQLGAGEYCYHSWRKGNVCVGVCMRVCACELVHARVCFVGYKVARACTRSFIFHSSF